MERSIKVGLFLAPALALTLALGALYLLPTASHGAPGALLTPDAEVKPKGSIASLVKAGNPVELEVMDVIPIEEAQTHAVLLVSKDQALLLPLFVTEEAAVSIAFRLAQQDSPHPLAADLLDDVVSKMGGTVTSVEIDDVQDDVYTSQIKIRQGEKDLSLAARPSDAIAMALTGKARIFVTAEVMAEAGISREDLEALGGGMSEDFGVGGSGEEGGPLPEGHPEIPLPGDGADDASNIRL